LVALGNPSFASVGVRTTHTQLAINITSFDVATSCATVIQRVQDLKRPIARSIFSHNDYSVATANNLNA
jgi:hypothetical protein